jgi:hypothetical protein
MNKLDELLEFLEDNIDLNFEKEKENLYLDTIDYKKVPFLPIQIAYPKDKSINEYPYEETFNEPEKMLYNELTLGLDTGSINSVYNSVKLKDYFPLHIRSNHGIGLISSLFGAEYKIINNNMPWVEPYKNINEINQIISNGIPEFNSDLLKKVINDYQYFNNKLKQYPVCYKAIKITQPDLQGPFDIAHLLCGANIFLYLYDYADLMHQLLDLITTVYIEFKKYLENLNLLTDRAGEDTIYIHGAIYKGNVLIKDDTALVNLSENMYEEFSKQYNEKIIKAFGKSSLHYCGPGRDWHTKVLMDQNISSINYGNPEMQNLITISNNFKKQNISIIMWGNGQYYNFLRSLFKSDISSGVTLCIKADSFENACRILEEYKNP